GTSGEAAVGIAGGADRELFAEACNIVERRRRRRLPGAEAPWHGVVDIKTCRQRAVTARLHQQRAADLLASGERRIENQARRLARDQKPPFELMLRKVCL